MELNKNFLFALVGTIVTLLVMCYVNVEINWSRAVICFFAWMPYRIGKHHYSLFGGFSENNCYSLFGLFQKAGVDAFQVIGFSLFQIAGNNATQGIGISLYQKAVNYAIKLFGISLYQKAGNNATQGIGISLYQKAGNHATQGIGISLYQKAKQFSSKCSLYIVSHKVEAS
jgi:hypothetical protein